MPAKDDLNLATDCWFLTGPTAAGKTLAGLELAERIGAEIISLDSMSIYRDMDLGTAKPTEQQQARLPHHLIDIVNPDQEYSLAEYVNAAHQAAADIHRRGKRVLFVGGTSLYLKSLLRGLYSGPPADWEFRNQVAAEVAEVGSAALHQRLQQVDPLAAAKLHPHDQRRIIRALEVYKATGQPLSHRQTHFDEGRPAEQCRVFALQWPRADLHKRIESRVEQMFQRRLIDEAQGLLRKYQSLSRTALQAVGYREAFAHVQDDAPLDATIEKVKVRTRRFARRQETWLRSLSECRPIKMDAEKQPTDLACEIVENSTRNESRT